MTDNYENNNYSNQELTGDAKKPSWTDGNSEMIRLLTVALSSFLGAFLAVALLGRMLLHDYVNSHIPNPQTPVSQNATIEPSVFDEDEMFRTLNRDFEMMTPRFVTPIATTKFQVVKFEENNDNYKITIDLKQFHDDERNVTVDVKPHLVKISGKASMKSDNAQSSFSYFQEMPLAKKADIDDIKKEKIGNNYIITIPFED